MISLHAADPEQHPDNPHACILADVPCLACELVASLAGDPAEAIELADRLRRSPTAAR